MKTVLLGAALMLSALFAYPAVANGRFHVNHEHEHKRYQPPPQEQGDNARPAPATTQQSGS